MPFRTRMLSGLLAMALAGCAVDDAPDPGDEITGTGAEIPGGTMADASGNDRQAEDLPVTQPPIPREPPPRRMPGTEELPDGCDADAARDAIGKVATAEVVEQARLAAGAAVVRTLTPGQMVTMEYHNSRLTLDVDESNVVVGVRCG